MICQATPSLIIDPLRILKDRLFDILLIHPKTFIDYRSVEDTERLSQPSSKPTACGPSLIIDPLRILKADDEEMPEFAPLSFIDYRSVEDTERSLIVYQRPQAWSFIDYRSVEDTERLSRGPPWNQRRAFIDYRSVEDTERPWALGERQALPNLH